MIPPPRNPRTPAVGVSVRGLHTLEIVHVGAVSDLDAGVLSQIRVTQCDAVAHMSAEFAHFAVAACTPYLVQSDAKSLAKIAGAVQAAEPLGLHGFAAGDQLGVIVAHAFELVTQAFGVPLFHVGPIHQFEALFVMVLLVDLAMLRKCST